MADYERHAVYVGFFDNAMPEERQAVKEVALASPLDDRIEEGIIPAQKYPRLDLAVGRLPWAEPARW